MELYDIHSIELYELIDKTRVKLRKSNAEYKELHDQASKIMDKHPNVRLVLEEEAKIGLTQEECAGLQDLISIFMKMNIIEEKEIFFLGAKENYLYFKKMGIIE